MTAWQTVITWPSQSTSAGLRDVYQRMLRASETPGRFVTLPTGKRVHVVAAQLIPDARLEVLSAGHVPQLGHPEQVAKLLTAFARG